MKKNSLFTMMVIAMVSVAVVSCKKDNQEQAPNNQKQTVHKVIDMDSYLMAFKNKLLSSEKEDAAMGLDQACHDLGNLLNFDFGDANHPTDVFQRDTIHAKLSVNNNGTVRLSQLASAYNTLVGDIIDSYNNTLLPEKSIQNITCEIRDLENAYENNKEVEVVVIYRGFVGTRFGIHDTLDWRPGRRAGTCDGQFVGELGAPKVLQDWVWQTQPEVDCINGGRVYYTDGDDCYIFGNQTQDPITGEYGLFYYVGNNPNSECITHEEMEAHFSYILNIWNNNVPYNHVLLDVYIQLFSNDCCEHYWILKLRHAKPNCTGTDPLV